MRRNDPNRGEPAAGCRDEIGLVGLGLMGSTRLGSRLGALGIEYLDATVSGNSDQVRAGETLIMAGGTPAGFAACEDLLRLFATRVRAAGSGISYSVGRFATAIGVFFAGVLFAALGGSYSRVGSLCGLIYALGLIVIWWAPDTSRKNLREGPSPTNHESPAISHQVCCRPEPVPRGRLHLRRAGAGGAFHAGHGR